MTEGSLGEGIARNSWFSARAMKSVGDAIIIMDVILLLAWISGAIYILVNYYTLCFQAEFVVHFLILIHFALGMCITSILDAIGMELSRAEEARRPEPITLPLQFYSPREWLFTSLLSLSGDTLLLIASVLGLQAYGDTDECKHARIAHIAFDSLALLVSLITIGWFIAFAIYTIANRHYRMAASPPLLLQRGLTSQRCNRRIT